MSKIPAEIPIDRLDYIHQRDIPESDREAFGNFIHYVCPGAGDIQDNGKDSKGLRLVRIEDVEIFYSEYLPVYNRIRDGK